MFRRILVTVVLVAAGTTVRALQQARPPAFEVASVKPIAQDSDVLKHRGFGCLFISRGRVSCIGWARYLIAQAYDLPMARLEQIVIGGPAWIVQDLFEIQVVLPDDDQETVDTDRFRLMLRGLLADRFKLIVHQEPREVAGHAFVMVIDHIERPAPD